MEAPLTELEEITKQGQNFSFVYVYIDVHQTLSQSAMEADRRGRLEFRGETEARYMLLGISMWMSFKPIELDETPRGAILDKS